MIHGFLMNGCLYGEGKVAEQEESGVVILKRSLQFVGLACALGLLVPLALAQETHVSRDGRSWSEEITGSLTAVKNLRVKVDMGAVIVHGGPQQEIRYVVHAHSRSSSEQGARHELESYKISAYVRGDTAWIVGDWQGGRQRNISSEFTVNVPREMASARIDTEGGNIEATGISGRVDAQSGGGGIRVDDIGGIVNAETGGGSIDAGTIGGDLGLHTGGGSIEVRHANGKVVVETGGGHVEIQSGAQGASIETGGGSIDVKQCSGKVKASTGGGSVNLGNIDGPAEIDTGGGTIHLTSAKGHVRAETGGGGIELDGVPSARAETGAGGIVVKLLNTGGERHDSVLETSAGDITVYLAADVAVSVWASVELGNGHRITSEFPDIHVTTEGGPYGPKTYTAEGKLNGGGPELKVRTTTGDICFKKASR